MLRKQTAKTDRRIPAAISSYSLIDCERRKCGTGGRPEDLTAGEPVTFSSVTASNSDVLPFDPTPFAGDS